MSPEERDELMQFLLQSQSNAASRHDEAMKESKEHTSQIQALAAVSHDLVEVARLHSRRLDRLDGLTP